MGKSRHIDPIPEIMILMSGGVDSMACAEFYRSMRRPLCGMFVDYGQVAALPEANAAAAIAHHLAIPLMHVTSSGPTNKTSGEIPARNAFLLSIAAMEKPSSVSALALGIHAGTDYADCTAAFVDASKALLRFQRAPLDVLAPFVEWEKQDIIEYALTRQLPLELTYSCDFGTIPPCGTCKSCIDRRVIDARA